ncbi:hypothetical protein OSB04_006374 [Centaurea solstitialis]|uniref:Reverse transcriptase Ty1/copia-type domain-containing protein n=1 Tax=Centaurea solstitialis TaxID=347529 RepID=A0AA38WRZ5_9ASTR|nr:hypothetical protein OSB04_006374 [Centaurea solstitialis]
MYPLEEVRVRHPTRRKEIRSSIELGGHFSNKLWHRWYLVLEGPHCCVFNKGPEVLVLAGDSESIRLLSVDSVVTFVSSPSPSSSPLLSAGHRRMMLSAGITILKQSLSAIFEMKDLGNLHYFLGLEVLSDSASTYLCQAKYTSDLLSRASITDNKVEPHLHLTPNAVTRPDIAYAVHTVSQFMSAPCSDHYAAVLRILRDLKVTMFHGLYFSSTSSLTLRGFSDADWDSDMTDRVTTQNP